MENLDAFKLIYSRILVESTNFKTENYSTAGIPSGEVNDILGDEGKNIALQTARKFNPTYSINTPHPKSSLQHQYVIGKAFELAANENPDYQRSVHQSYLQHKPEIAAGTKSYSDLVDKTYGAAKKDTDEQFRALPVSMTFHSGEHEYHNSGEMVADVHKNRNINVYSGGEPHSHFTLDPDTGLTTNEKFRATHDFFGHAIHGNQFGPKGEEIAWNSHRQMYSPTSVPAVTSETRGQNSFVNYTTYNLNNLEQMKHHRQAAMVAPTAGEAEFHRNKVKEIGRNFNYARQIAVVLPHEMSEPTYSGEVPHSIKHLLLDPKAKENPVYNSTEDHLGISRLSRLYHPDNHHEMTTKLAKVHGFTSASGSLNESVESAMEIIPESVYAMIHQRKGQ